MKIEALFEKLAASFKAYVDRHVAPLSEQIKALQTQQKSYIVGEQISELITPLLPQAIKGDPGHTPTPDELQAIITPLIPAPLAGEKGIDGKDGRDGVDGKDGQDGHTPTADEIKSLIAPLIPVVEKAADGRDGINGKDGKDGADGRDALDFNPMPAIDETRSYPRNTYALHKGGIWRAFENTLAMRGWECIVRGFDGVDFVQVDDRTWTLKLLTSTDAIEKTIKIPSLLDRGVFKDGTTYEPGDVVTFGGNVWIAQKGIEQYGKPGEIGSGWRLSVRAGRDYRDPKR